MPLDKDKRARQLAKSKFISYKLQQFEVNDYTGNPNMIKTLNIQRLEALAEVRDLRDQLEEAQKSCHELELQKQTFEHRLDEANRKFDEANQQSLIQFIVTVAAAVVLGLGVNLATSTPSNWIGWGLVCIAVLLEAAAFLITFLRSHFSNKARKGN